MQAYMKSALPFRGVPRPGQKAIFAALLSEHLLPDQAAWHDTVLELWDDAGFREERYAAIAQLKSFKPQGDPKQNYRTAYATFKTQNPELVKRN